MALEEVVHVIVVGLRSWPEFVDTNECIVLVWKNIVRRMDVA